MVVGVGELEGQPGHESTGRIGGEMNPDLGKIHPFHDRDADCSPRFLGGQPNHGIIGASARSRSQGIRRADGDFALIVARDPSSRNATCKNGIVQQPALTANTVRADLIVMGVQQLQPEWRESASFLRCIRMRRPDRR